MDKGQSAPVGRAEERRQEQAAREAAALKITPETSPPMPPAPSRGAQFTDWAAI